MPQAAYDVVRAADAFKAAVTRNLERWENDYEDGFAVTRPSDLRETLDLVAMIDRVEVAALNLAFRAETATVPTRAA